MIRFIRTQSWLLSAVFMLSLAGEGLSQARRGGGAYGDWKVSMEFDGREIESIVALSRDPAGNRTGQWISFWGANKLKDVQFDNGALTFSWSIQGFDGETHTSSFTGRIADNQLTGTVSGERGDLPVKGARVRWQPRAVGNWVMKYQVGGREITPTLKVTADAERNLTGEWNSEQGEHNILEISAERNQLTFKRSSNIDGYAFETAFMGTMDRDTLSGTFSTEHGELDVTGTRVGADAIGTWMLDVSSEQGSRQQRLRINRDLSALYGAIEVANVTIDENQISFPLELDFGEQSFDMSVQATLDGTTLTGQLITPRGTRDLTGAKVVRAPRRRGGGTP